MNKNKNYLIFVTYGYLHSAYLHRISIVTNKNSVENMRFRNIPPMLLEKLCYGEVAFYPKCIHSKFEVMCAKT